MLVVGDKVSKLQQVTLSPVRAIMSAKTPRRVKVLKKVTDSFLLPTINNDGVDSGRRTRSAPYLAAPDPIPYASTPMGSRGFQK